LFDEGAKGIRTRMIEGQCLWRSMAEEILRIWCIFEAVSCRIESDVGGICRLFHHFPVQVEDVLFDDVGDYPGPTPDLDLRNLFKIHEFLVVFTFKNVT
jgi:hypothetical protein